MSLPVALAEAALPLLVRQIEKWIEGSGAKPEILSHLPPESLSKVAEADALAEASRLLSGNRAPPGG